MSMPFTQFSCKGCDFTADSTVLWGSFSYQLEEGKTLYVDRCLGWCHQCNTLTPIEDLSGGDARKQIVEAERELKAIENRAGLWNSLKKLFNSQAHIQEIKYWQERKTDGEKVFSFLAHRSDPPRCLFCSSTDVVLVPHGWSAESDTAATIGLTHPGCGGHLLAAMSSYQVSLRLSKRLYLPNGVLIDGNI